MASDLTEFHLNEGASEGTVEEMQARIRKPEADGPELPVKSIVILPSMLAMQWDRAGIEAEVSKQSGENLAELRVEVKRLHRLASCIKNPLNRKWIDLVAKELGFPDVMGVDGVKYTGGRNLCAYLNSVEKMDKQQGNESLLEKFERQRTLLETLDKVIEAYLVRVEKEKAKDEAELEAQLAALVAEPAQAATTHDADTEAAFDAFVKSS